jgi:hypothetical protein
LSFCVPSGWSSLLKTTLGLIHSPSPPTREHGSSVPTAGGRDSLADAVAVAVTVVVGVDRATVVAGADPSPSGSIR